MFHKDQLYDDDRVDRRDIVVQNDLLIGNLKEIDEVQVDLRYYHRVLLDRQHNDECLEF